MLRIIATDVGIIDKQITYIGVFANVKQVANKEPFLYNKKDGTNKFY